jgi:hypothetical protein
VREFLFCVFKNSHWPNNFSFFPLFSPFQYRIFFIVLILILPHSANKGSMRSRNHSLKGSLHRLTEVEILELEKKYSNQLLEEVDSAGNARPKKRAGLLSVMEEWSKEEEEGQEESNSRVDEPTTEETQEEQTKQASAHAENTQAQSKAEPPQGAEVEVFDYEDTIIHETPADGDGEYHYDAVGEEDCMSSGSESKAPLPANDIAARDQVRAIKEALVRHWTRDLVIIF